MDFVDIARKILIYAPGVLIAVTLHEAAHGFVANRLGDPTARMMGRMTLNPIKHIDPVGTILIPAMVLLFTGGSFVFGYAKPVPINPYNFKNPKKDMAISAAGGPATNIALALISAIILKVIIIAAGFLPDAVINTVLKPMSLMLNGSIFINVILAVFNMIPVPPLDGGRVLIGFLPDRHAATYSRIEPYGMMIVILLIVTGIAQKLMLPIIILLMGLITLIL